MIDDPPTLEAAVPSADQQAVAAYLASATYAARQEIAVHSPGFLRWMSGTPIGSAGETSAFSLWCGILGLAGLLLACGTLIPVGFEVVDTFVTTRPTFIAQTLLVFGLVIPPIIVFSFATVTPMFWYGSVVVRFLTGLACVLPGCAAFCVGMTLIQGNPPDDFFYDFAAIMFTQFLTAGSVALTMQMWSGWTLTHARPSDAGLPPLGTRALMELTGVAAIGFAIFASLDTLKIIEGLLVFAVLGVLSSLAIISVCIGLLRERRIVLAATLTALCAYGIAFVLAGTCAVGEYGSGAIVHNLPIMVALSLPGAAITCVMLWVCLAWLRCCGWRCVHRGKAKPALD